MKLDKSNKASIEIQKCSSSSHLLFAMIVFLLLNSVVLSQFTWTRILGRPGLNDVSWSCLTLRDGNFLAVGYKTVISLNNGTPIPQTYLVKFGINGDILWERIYGDSLNPNESRGVIEDPVGNLYIASNWNTPRLIKTDFLGNILWFRNFTLPIIGFGSIRLIDNYRKVLISGINDSISLFAASLTKVDTSGNLIWTKSYRDSLEHSFPYNAYIVTGNSYFIMGSRLGAPLSSRYFYMRLDTSGNVIWKKFAPFCRGITSVCMNSDNTFILTGSGLNFGLYCLKFDLNGDTLWHREYAADSLSLGSCIVKTLDNNFAVSTRGYQGKGKFAIIDSLGNLLINKEHYFGPNDVLDYFGIDAANDSGFILSGYIEPNEQGTVDFLVVKTDKYGNTTPIGIINQSSTAIDFELELNTYPNPFNSQTIIQFKISKSSNVNLKLFNIVGQEVSVLKQGFFKSGTHKVQFSPESYSLASGIYFITVEVGNDIAPARVSKKIAYIK